MKRRPKIIRKSQLKEHISKMVMEQGYSSYDYADLERKWREEDLSRRDSIVSIPEAKDSIYDAADAIVSVIDYLEKEIRDLKEYCALGGGDGISDKLDRLSDSSRIKEYIQDLHSAVDRADAVYREEGDMDEDAFEQYHRIMGIAGKVAMRKLGK